jgi:hypothetical protein
MSRPLIMSFRADACALCLDGRKRRTRRIWKPEWHAAAAHPAREIVSIYHVPTGRVLWEVGEPITIKPSRTAKGSGQVMCTGLRRERVQDITEEEALLEGVCVPGTHRYHGAGYWIDTPCPTFVMSACDAFRRVWRSLYPSGPRSWDENPEVAVIEFEPMEVPR